MQFVLASASPARQRLLRLAGIEPIIQPSGFDEDQVTLTDPAELVETLAQGKASSVADSCPADQTQASLILGCDSVLAIQGEIHGKPANAAEALQRWQQMRGQVGELFTGHALIYCSLQGDRKLMVRHRITRVYFTHPSDDEIQAYIATGEPLTCAGCFALEGRGGLFVDYIEGCHTNVIGLSLPLLREMMQGFGLAVTDFWQHE